MYELLTPAQMNKADQLTISGGVAGIELMEAAGKAVCDTLLSELPDARRILIICGNGNNGGDGLIAARILADAGLDVDLLLTGNKDHMQGDAAIARDRLGSNIAIVDGVDQQQYDVIMDALFGAGLDRDIEEKLAGLIREINENNTPVLSVDLPSGIDGATGEVLGVAIRADFTVTFFRKKPGHFLYPGRDHCGQVFVRQIGIRPTVLERIGIATKLNTPQLWRENFPVPEPGGHKYNRGHTLVVSGEISMCGAARLVAGSALRAGSGLVTIASSADVLHANAASVTSVMLREGTQIDKLLEILQDKRMNCVATGPGMQPDPTTCAKVLAILSAHRHTVLDAGALSAFGGKQEDLFAAIKAAGKSVVLTPHEGEFFRLFTDQTSDRSKIGRAQSAARISGATIVLKGPDTVVASPGGDMCIADNAPPWLATAGSGDVLTGIIAGLLAQGMPPFEAAAAAVWIHGDAATRLGMPMISSDLDQGIRQSISALIKNFSKAR